MAAARNIMKLTIVAEWKDRYGRWHPQPLSEQPKRSEWALAGAPADTPQWYRDQLEEAIADPAKHHVAMDQRAGFVRGDMFVIVEVLPDVTTSGWARVRLEDFKRLLEWWIAVKESPDFRNPDAVIEPIEIEYDLEIPDDLHPELSQAMGVADEIIIADKFTRGRKLDDGAIFVWEPIEPWGRGFIWDPEDETWLLSPSSISHEQQIANWNNGQRTTVDDL